MAFMSGEPIQNAIGPPANPLGGLTERAAFALVVGYVVLLAAYIAHGIWLIDGQGQGIPTDFVNVWAAGRLVFDGNAPGAYDWSIHKAVEELGVGHPFDLYFGWHYPPPYLFVAAVLSILPYAPAFLAWIALTLPTYAAVIRSIVGHRIGFILACAFPGAFWNIAVGQNGFLTAALLGGVVNAMERRPLLAGFLLGLLSYKPQIGIVFPLVLAVSGQWRVFWAAAVTALGLAAVSWLTFGSETWQAFGANLAMTNESVLGNGLAGFQKLQSVFGVVRWYGGDETLAWIAQGTMAAACTVAVSLLWRRQLAYEIKVAALATAALLATPYIYVYDLAALAVPLAFLIRIGLREGFQPGEAAGLALAAGLVLAFPVVSIPSGFCAVLLVGCLVGARALRSLSSRTSSAARTARQGP
jgi:arabinofuranan 3-O-arabinosyltransferase